MVRAPCCEKMGLKKGPWTRDEDLILINHVTLYGHGNWRALPKQAGLLRCGKSCRLRWTNYLSPDIKRGNFSQEEEETIINLHQVLGNRWSAIAAKLPGRTDNEIKNVWHTHLKKRIKNNIQEINAPIMLSNNINAEESRNLAPTIPSKSPKQEKICKPNSPQQQSSITTATSTVDDNSVSMNADDALTDFLEIDDTFWSEVFSTENSSTTSDFVADNSSASTSEFSGTDDFDLKFLEFGGYDDDDHSNINISSIINMDSGAMDNFWYNMLTNSSAQLPEL